MPRRKSFLPRTLKVLAKLPNKGKLRVTDKKSDGKWVTHYDVTTPEGRWIGDIHPLTTEQIERWTGVDMNAEEALHASES